MKKVLVYENRKTDPVVWDVSTPDQERGAALELFNLLDEVWGAYADLSELEEPANPCMTLEEISRLPDGPVREAAEKEHSDHKRLLRDYQEALSQRALYERCKEGDPQAALSLLRKRQDYEYESWRVFTVQSRKA